jgi:hypothetical protein
MKPSLDAERNTVDTSITPMAYSATRHAAASDLSKASEFAVVSVAVASTAGLVAPALALPVLGLLLIGLGVILLPEDTRCGPPGN